MRDWSPSHGIFLFIKICACTGKLMWLAIVAEQINRILEFGIVDLWCFVLGLKERMLIFAQLTLGRHKRLTICGSF